MRFDPAADPWGTAMLAAAALWLLSLFVVTAALMAGTSRRTGGRMMLVSLIAFMGAAVGGAWVEIRGADTLAEQTAPPDPGELIAKIPAAETSDGRPEASTNGTNVDSSIDSGDVTREPESASTGGPQTTTEGSTREPETASTGEPHDDTTGTHDDTTGDGTTGTPDDTEGQEPDDTAGDEPETAGTVPPIPPPLATPAATMPVVPEDLPQVNPLPSDPAERDAAIRRIIEDAEQAAGGGRRCGNLDRVALAWARLRLVPASRKAKSAAADLDQCRRRLLYSISQRRLGEQKKARDAFFDALPGRIRKEHGLIVQASVSGGSHNRLRVGNRELDAARADAIMNAGLLDELVRLEFAHIVMSNGKKTKTYEISVTPESELGLPWLRAVGLGEPLELGN